MAKIDGDGHHSGPYQGNCHCGQFRFEIRGPPGTEIRETVVVCSCAGCRKKGYLWVKYVEGETSASVNSRMDVDGDEGVLDVLRDEGSLRAYCPDGNEQERDGLREQFCGHCGTGIFGEHREGPLAGRRLVNARAIMGLNPFVLESSARTVEGLDGRVDDIQGQRRDEQDEDEERHEVVACHCGKVKAELLITLSELEIKEDNCSSCVRTAFIGIYPTKSQVRIHGREHTFEYIWGRKLLGAAHCASCGVHVFNNVYGPPLSVFDSLLPDRKEMALGRYWKNMDLQPLNLRAMEGLRLEEDVSIMGRIVRADEGTEGYVLS